MSDTAQLNVTIPIEMRKQVKVAAAEHNHTLSELTRAALEEYLEQLEDCVRCQPTEECCSCVLAT